MRRTTRTPLHDTCPEPLPVILNVPFFCFGLAISAFAATEEMAITLIPMAIIPQIILSGAIVPLGTAAKWLAMVTISVYWGKQGLDDCLSGHDAEAASSEAAIGVLLLHTCAGVTAALLLLYWQSRRARAPS